MPSRKVLKSVAHNVVKSFCGPRWYRDHDFLSGHVLAAAHRRGVNRVEVDLIARSLSPTDLLVGEAAEAFDEFVEWGREGVVRQGADRPLLAEARLAVEFDLARAERDRTGELSCPAVCCSRIVDDRGRSTAGARIETSSPSLRIAGDRGLEGARELVRG